MIFCALFLFKLESGCWKLGIFEVRIILTFTYCRFFVCLLLILRAWTSKWLAYLEV